MAAEPLNEPDLAALLSEAIRDYKDSWEPVDNELYELCGRRRHDDFEDVFTKVVIVGRVYSAGVARAWGGERGPDSDPETETTRALIEQPAAHLIQEGLQRLAGHKGHFDPHRPGRSLSCTVMPHTVTGSKRR